MAIGRLLHLYWRFSRGLTLGVRGAVFDRDNAVLLVRHSYERGWHLPGGGVEPGESVLAALRRELAEEGNVLVTGSPRLHGIFHVDRGWRRDHIALFVVREFERDGAKASGWEIREATFFPVDRLPADTSDSVRRRLREILDGTDPDPNW